MNHNKKILIKKKRAGTEEKLTLIPTPFIVGMSNTFLSIKLLMPQK